MWLRTDLVRLDFSLTCVGRGEAEALLRTGRGPGPAPPWGAEEGRLPGRRAPARGTAPGPRPAGLWRLRDLRPVTFLDLACVRLGSFALGFLFGFWGILWVLFLFLFFLFHCKLYTEMSRVVVFSFFGVFFVCFFVLVFCFCFCFYFLSSHFPSIVWYLGFKSSTLALGTVVSVRRARAGR